ncbi:hypothetical protein [Nocardia stercoris]|uniref:hypothetical protein n=1 Tax=Nocardia stercoris TaxID=2483361 RepID=UPI0011C459F3|nr:hypothetical protein [Nocardia stercoris]
MLPTSRLQRPGRLLVPRLDELSPRAAAAAVRHHLDRTDLQSFARSSPARLLALGVVLLLLCLSAGAVTASTVSNRRHSLQTVLGQSEPDAVAAQGLYTSLSVADAAAGAAFIAGGVEPKELRDRYDQAIAQASSALVTMSDGSATDSALRADLATGLPVYTGLIETARANNRAGRPVGAAYLSEASNMMQTTMLPKAQQLLAHRSAAITEIQHEHVQIPWAALVADLFALTALIAAQLYLAQYWRRMFNAGLLLASGTLTVLLAWTIIAGVISAIQVDSARAHGATPMATLTSSRILTQQARSAETLKLVRRDASGDYDRTFDTAVAQLGDQLAHYPSDAPGARNVAAAKGMLAAWRQAHQRMNDALSRGDFPGASQVAVGPGPTEATAQVDSLDKALADGIVSTRTQLRDDVSSGYHATSLLSPGGLAVSLLAAGFVVLGIWPRLREYR